MGEEGGGGASGHAFHVADPILVPIALFASLSRRGLGTRSEKGDGDENAPILDTRSWYYDLVGQNAQC